MTAPGARALVAAVLVFGCGPCKGAQAPVDAGGAQSAASPPGAPRESVIDLTDALRDNVIDTAGPVVDLGERQGDCHLVTPATLSGETVNGDSWVNVGSRIQLRVPLDDVDGERPTSVRMRLRRAASRVVSVLVDGVLVRASVLPERPDGAPFTLSLPVPADRFARPVATVEIRFGAARATPGVLSPVAAQLDWVHLARREVEPARVGHLAVDVAVERTPRRALAFYAPTRLSTVMILPRRATWTAALAAEGPRGGMETPAPVTAVLRADVDGEAPLVERVELAPNSAWHESAIDLRAFGGRAVRLSVAAEGEEESRLAVASPSLRVAGDAVITEDDGGAPRATVRHVVMVVVRGLRLDRVAPQVAPHLDAGGFARMAAEGLTARAHAPAPREFTSLVSATSGLPADVHRVAELTDRVDDEAPTLAEALSRAGVDTAAWTDDVAWVGSGADRGFAARQACPGDTPTCRPDTMFTAVAEALAARRDHPTFSMVVTRAGVLPLDPTPEDIAAVDARPYEGTMTPSRTALYATRTRDVVTLTEADQERLGTLYDASLRAVDRGLALLLDRIRDLDLDRDTMVIVVGDRGTALGESRAVGDGPLSLASVAETALLVRGPHVARGRADGVFGAVDAAATALHALGVERPAEFDGRPAGQGTPYDRALAFVATSRWELGLRLGDLVALPRAARDGGGFGLFEREGDPEAQRDLAAVRPIARGFVEATLARLRSSATRRVFPASTRVLPAPLDTVMRTRR